MIEILKIVSLMGGGMTILIALGFYAVRRFKLNTWFLFIIIISASITQYSAYMVMSNLYFETGGMNYLFVPVNSLFGPAFYFYYVSTLRLNFKMNFKRLMGFAPSFLFFAAYVLICVFDSNTCEERPHVHFTQGLKGPMNILLLAICIVNLAYYYLILQKVSILFNFRSLKTQFSARLFLSLFVFIGLINLTGIAGIFSGVIEMIYLCSNLITLCIVGFYLLSLNHPEFFVELEAAIQLAREKRSKVLGLDLLEVRERLIALMK